MSSRLVTRITVPPRPAGVVTPKPTAAGKTGSAASDAGLMTTIRTVSADVPLVADTIAFPGANAVTSPVEDTVATDGESLDHSTRPEPSPFRHVSESWTCAPTGSVSTREPFGSPTEITPLAGPGLSRSWPQATAAANNVADNSRVPAAVAARPLGGSSAIRECDANCPTPRERCNGLAQVGAPLAPKQG